MRALVDNKSSRVNGRRDVNKLIREGRTEFSAHGHTINAVPKIFC